MSRLLARSFYQRPDVIEVARDLLGMMLITNTDGKRTAGMITETEAYAGVTDRASHAYAGKRTMRNEPMYRRGGTAYIYLCYGVHHLFNVVTNIEGVPHAVLIRAVLPTEGAGIMQARRGGGPLRTNGPGMLSTALGIRTDLSGTDLITGPIRMEDHGIRVAPRDLVIGPRIGVDYAGADAELPYRFRIAPSRQRELAEG